MKSIYMALLLGLTSFAVAQHKLSGTVSDAQGKAIFGVNISIPELHKETVSDENGRYQFSHIPPGTFRVTFSFIGYATVTKSLVFSGASQQVDVQLQPSDQHMDEVIVSTAFNKLQSENVMKVEHVSSKSLQQKKEP